MKDKQMKILAFIKDKEQKMSFAHLLDVASAHGCSNFLHDYVILAFSDYLKALRIPHKIYFANLFSSKGIIYFGEECPVIHYRGVNTGIRHQDILGTLFASGLEDEVFGDIFVEKDYFYFSVLPKVKRAIDSINKIGGKVVQLEEIKNFELCEEHFISKQLSVASMRLDVMTSKLIEISREKTEQYLSHQYVRVNENVEKRKDFLVEEGMVLSIRHIGRFKIGKIVKNNKKNRYFVTVYQYK